MGQISFYSHRPANSSAATAAEAGILARSLDIFLTWHERRRGRANLAGMPDGMLKDIGLSRGDAEHEYEKPFWRG